MIGQTVSHFRITAELGRGGMGVVYEAEDLNLDRTVALKFLPQHLTADPEAKARFISEAKTASALDHASICTIHEIGETDTGQLFIAMARYEGRTLEDRLREGPLPLDDALTIAERVAEGLAEAHDHGVVHRDVKPANIFLCEGGPVKLLDFGVAKLGQGTGMTQVGQTMGTARYMAPEQANGQATDQRSDLWALGVVLSEMLTGQAPFQGEYLQAVMYAILGEEPEPLTGRVVGASADLDAVVGRLLAKDPAHRYQQARDLLTDLAALRGGTAVSAEPPPRSGRAGHQRLAVAGATVVAVAILAWLASRFWSPGIATEEQLTGVAVLPCVDREETAETSYFSEGVTDDIIMKLANLGSLKVINSSSVRRYKNTTLSPAEIADELGVQVLLHSNVRRDGERIRFTAQLIEAASDQVLWAESYEHELRDVWALWGEVATQVAEAMHAELTPAEAERLGRSRAVDPAVYEAYQKGRQLWQDQGSEAFLAAIAHFEKAVALDPDFALGYVGLADTYASFAQPSIRDGATPYSELLQIYHQYMGAARQAVDQALVLDPDLPEAQASLAHQLRWVDAAAAEREYERALAAKPNLAWAHFYYASMLLAHGRLDEAWRHATTAVELAPNDHWYRVMLARIHYSRGEDAAAEAAFRRLAGEGDEPIPTNPSVRGSALFGLVWLYMKLQRYEECVDAWKRWAELQGQSPEGIIALIDFVYGKLGLAQVEPVLEGVATLYSPIHSARVCGFGGEPEKALEYLERTLDLGDFEMQIAGRDIAFTALRGDPRYEDLLDRAGLPPTTGDATAGTSP